MISPRTASLSLVASATLAAILAYPTPARAERIVLRNGFELEGWITRETSDEVTLAILSGGSLGEMHIGRAEIDRIDRTRRESIQEAMERTRKERDAIDARRARVETETAAALPGAGPTQPSGGAAGPTLPRLAEAPAGVGHSLTGIQVPAAPGREPRAAPPVRASFPTSDTTPDTVAVPAPTPQESAAITLYVNQLGNVQRQGGAGTRRENAVARLVEIGPKALPALGTALQEPNNWYRRVNAADAIAGIAQEERSLDAYRDIVPILLSRLLDGSPFVRDAAGDALEAIRGGQAVVREQRWEEVDGRGDTPLTPEDYAAVERWTKWWEGARASLHPEQPQGMASPPQGPPPGRLPVVPE